MEVTRKKEDRGEEQRRFPRLKGKIEGIMGRMRRNVYMVAFVSMAAFAPMSCGPDPGPTDGGTTISDGGSDGGTTADGGGGGDGGANLCEQYPDGHQNRHTFSIGEARAPECGEYVLIFNEITDTGRVVFNYLNTTSPSGAEFLGFEEGDTKTRDVPGVGETTWQLCDATALPCKFNFGGTPSGDADCKATLASDRELCY